MNQKNSFTRTKITLMLWPILIHFQTVFFTFKGDKDTQKKSLDCFLSNYFILSKYFSCENPPKQILPKPYFKIILGYLLHCLAPGYHCVKGFVCRLWDSIEKKAFQKTSETPYLDTHPFLKNWSIGSRVRPKTRTLVFFD